MDLISSKLEVFEFSMGAEAPYQRGYMWPAMPIFDLGGAIPVKSHVWKFGSDWLSLSRVILVTNNLAGLGAETPYRGDTFDLWCPFSNTNELFQSKVKCKNLVRIGWNRRYVNFEEGQKPPIAGGGGGGGGSYMWLAMPIFKLGWVFTFQSHLWNFCLNWLSLSRVIVVTKTKKKKEKKITDTTENSILT